MCGIAGFVGGGSREILQKMTDALRHRGPDDSGFYLDENVGLGHRRLSIVDLGGGHQPMFNENKTVAVVFNGEIYNYQELKKDLWQKGHKFNSQSDTEVIIHLYEDIGEQVFEHLNGMFAMALWDKPKQKLVLARDRLGKKPLYYGVFGSNLIFGSELKALLLHPAVKKEIDWDSLNKYLTYEYVPTPHSIFKNIYKLEPGCFLIFQAGKMEIKKYWDIKFTPALDISETEAIARLDGLLADATKKRLMADVPLGIFLSGGLDSSTIAYYAKQGSGQGIKTFSIAFEDASFDESVYARQVAAILKTEHHQEILTPKNLLDLVPTITDLIDEPLADASIIPTYLLSKFTRQKVTVALGGDGGDELFFGYPTFQAEKMFQIINKFPKNFQQLLAKAVGKLPTSFNNISWDFKLKKFFSGLGWPDSIRHQLWLGTLNPKESKNLLAVEVQKMIKPEKLFEDIENLLKNVPGVSRENQINYVYLKQYLQDDILVKVDRASMFTSLEVRAPMLDYRIVDLVTGLPVNYKLHGWQTKYLLKKLMVGKLPPEIINRPKKGFGVPLAKWFNNELKSFLLEVLSERHIQEQGIFNYDYIKQLMDEHFAGRKDNRKHLWTILVWQLWYEKYGR